MVEMDWPPPGGQWTPAALQFVEHQLAQVSNFWKLGLPAEFHLVSNNDGTAELKLSFLMCGPGDSLPPPMPTSIPKSAPNLCGSQCLRKASPFQMRRGLRRAAGKAAAAEEVSAVGTAKEAATEEVAAVVAAKAAVADKLAAVVTAKEAAAEEVAAVVTAEEAAAKKAVAEKVGGKAASVAGTQLNSVENCSKAEIVKDDSEVDEHRVYGADASSPTCDVAVTSCLGSQLAPQENCWNCGEAFASDHQCDTSPPKPKSVKFASSLSLPPVPKQRPSPSAPIVLKKPVRMLDGSPAFPPRQKGRNS